MTENELLLAIGKICDELFLRWFHVRDSRHAIGTPGFPDLVIAGPYEKVLFAECKKDPWTKPSPDQTLWRYTLQACGGDWRLWTPYDYSAGIIHYTLERMAGKDRIPA